MKQITKKQIIKNYIATRDLTALCRDMKKIGIVTRKSIFDSFYESYSYRYLHRCGIDVYKVAYVFLKSNLNEKEKKREEPDFKNLLSDMKANKASGRYSKILIDIEGTEYIYWASPVYRYSDYNKSRWRVKTPENLKKMDIINAYLNH